MLYSWSSHHLWLFKSFIALLRVIIRSEKHWPEETSIYCTLIYHNRIFLIVASVSGYGNYWVTAWWQLFEMEEVHWSSCHQRLLRIVKHMGQSIHSLLIITSIYSHCLFAHSTLIGISWWLIMIRKRNNRGTNSQYHWGMDFTMRVCVILCPNTLQILKHHCYHRCFLFFNI